MRKKTKAIISLTATAILAFGSALLVGCGEVWPDYINPDAEGEVSDDGSKYVVNVSSVGGLKLNNVLVSAKKNGATVRQGVSKNGKVTFDLEPDEYELQFDDLPEGYLQPETPYRTTADEMTVNCSFLSRVISSSASSGTVYSVGSVMHDFAFTDAETNENYTLSALLEDNKAVVLNFWYIACNPCKSEIPAMQEAYEAYQNKLKIVALSAQDSVNAIKSFKQEYGVSFFLGADYAGLTNKFNVTGFPTTVMIDRYGVVAYRDSGAQPNVSAWMALFDQFTSDSYVQKDDETSSGGGESETLEREKPTEVMPASDEINAAITNDGFNGVWRAETETGDAEYSWPFVLGSDADGAYLSASNCGKDYSFATVHVDVSLQPSDSLSFEYKISTEQYCDVLYVIYDGKIVGEYSGASGGWVRVELDVADRAKTVRLTFLYNKDQADAVTIDEFAGIRNVTVTPKTSDSAPFDRKTELGNESIALSFSDGYYHLTRDGSMTNVLLYADLLNPSKWTEQHCDGETTETADETSYYNAPYHISFWEFSTTDDDGNRTVLLNGKDYTETLFSFYYYQMFSANGLVPVTQALREMLIDFTKEYASRHNQTYSEKDWLQLCYYFEHFGAEHENDDCFAYTDPIKGMATFNCYEARVGSNQAIVPYPLATNRGTYYRFTAPQAGVYAVLSQATGATDPELFVKDENGNLIGQAQDMITQEQFTDANLNDFQYYRYFEAGETVYLLLACGSGITGEFPFTIDYLGESYDLLRVCSTGSGAFIGITDDDGNIIGSRYDAIEVGYDAFEGYYRAVESYSYGSPIYIDFVLENFLDQNGHTLLWMIENGYFDFTDLGGDNYTAAITEYYQRSIENKETTDPLYGKTEATQELVDMLNMMIEYKLSDYANAAEDAWLSMAYYYQHFGA